MLHQRLPGLDELKLRIRMSIIVDQCVVQQCEREQLQVVNTTPED